MGTIRKEDTGAWDTEGDGGCQMFSHAVLKTMKGTETKSHKTGRPQRERGRDARREVGRAHERVPVG